MHTTIGKLPFDPQGRTMRNSKSLRSIFAMLLALGLIASACGSDSDPVASGDDTSADDTAAQSDDGGDDSEPADDGGDDSEPTDDGPAMADGSTLTIAVDWDVAPRGYDGVDLGNELFPFYSAVYDTLFMTDVNGDVVPSLVKEFSQNEETTNLVLTLHEGSTFSDGSPVNAETVKANLDRRGTNSAAGAPIALYNVFLENEEGYITDIEVTGEYDLTINFGQPTGSAHELFADNVGLMIGPSGLADFNNMNDAPDGSGPYELVPGSTTRGNTYMVTKRADHWNSDAYAFDNIVFDVIVDNQARANAVISGQADIAIDMDAGLLDLVRSESSLGEVGGVMGSLPILDKTGEVQPEFANLEVRHAIAYAIDREKIVEALVPGGRATSQMFPEAAEGYDPARDDLYAYDPDKARELMASVGLEDGFEFDFVVLGPPSDFKLAVQQMLEEEINIKINWVTATATEQLFASTRTQPMLISPWALGNSPAGFIRGPVTTGFMNHQGASSEAIESVLGPALGGAPPALAALNAAMADEGWWVTVYEAKFYVGYDDSTVMNPPHAGTNNWLVISAIEPA